jgi:hypothetical protein
MFPWQQENTAIMEEMFSTRFMPKPVPVSSCSHPRVDVGLNTYIIALRVVGGGEKKNPVPRSITGPPCCWRILIWGPGPPGW